jgi:formiminotetrahydrofolate cyclodeaminase
MTERKAPYIGRPMRDYIEEAASNAPTPGGGSVSALAAALGTTMASMAANFTVGKKKFADVEAQVKELLGELGAERAKLLDATQRDTEAYAGVGAAYGMPKGTDEEKAARKAAIQKALVGAMAPPLEALRSSVEALRATRGLLDIANPNLITDVGVAAILLEAAARGAQLNVAINLKSIKDDELVEKTRAEVATALEEARRLEREVAEGVEAAITK